MSTFSLFIIISCIICFGGTFIYFVRRLDKMSEHKITSSKLIVYFFSDIHNIIIFYKNFFNSYPQNKKIVALILLILHITSPFIFWYVVLLEAIRTGELSFY